MSYTELTIGATVALRSKGASTGRTGQVIELNDGRARVHWTKKSNGQALDIRNWINAGELIIVGEGKAITSVRKKMAYIINRVEQGPLVQEERDELFAILGKIKGDNLWATGIRSYMEGARDHDDQFIAGLAEQCMDDIFTMVCIVGQKAVIYLLRTVNA